MSERPVTEADPLTATELLLLEWTRAGALDAEIAVRLSTSVGDVKMRFERLMSRAGVATRGALRTWDPDATPEAPEALAEEPGVGSHPLRRLWLIPVAAALLGLTAAGAWYVSGAGKVGREPAKPASAAPPAPFPTPDAFVVGVAVEPFRAVPAADFPAGLMLYVLTGCAGCATAPSGLDMIWRDQDGVLHADTVFPAPPPNARISGVAATPGATQLAVSVVTEGPVGRDERDAVTFYYRSTNGGASWFDVATVAGSGAVVRILEGGSLLVREARPDSDLTLRILPGEPLAADGAVVVVLPQAPPEEFAFIERLGQEIVEGLTRVVPGETGFAFAWHPVSAYPNQTDTLVRVGKATPAGEIERIFQHSGSPLALGPWVDRRTIIGDLSVYLSAQLQPSPAYASFTHLPALIDLEAGTITPIREPFTTRRYVEGANLVIAALRGTFARINGATGCVQLRPEPFVLIGRSLECLVDGTVVSVGGIREVTGETFIRLRAPSGALGWALLQQPGLEGFRK